MKVQSNESGFTRKRRSTNPIVDNSFSATNSQIIFQPPSDHKKPRTIHSEVCEDTLLSNTMPEEQEPNVSVFDTSGQNWDIDSGMPQINSLEVLSFEPQSDSGIPPEEIATGNSPSWYSSNIGVDSPQIARIDSVRFQTRDYQPQSDRYTT